MKDKLPVEDMFSKDLIYSIGLLFVIASHAEHALVLQLARLIAHPKTIDNPTVLALTGTRTSILLRQIQILARHRLELRSEHVENILKQCDKIRTSFDRRNDFAHYAAIKTSDRDKIILKTVKMRENGELVPDKAYNTKQIREYAVTLQERVRVLDQLLNDAGLRRLTESLL